MHQGHLLLQLRWHASFPLAIGLLGPRVRFTTLRFLDSQKSFTISQKALFKRFLSEITVFIMDISEALALSYLGGAAGTRSPSPWM